MRRSGSRLVRRLVAAGLLAAATTATVTPVSASALPRPGHRTPVNPKPAPEPAATVKPVEPKTFDSVASGSAIIAHAATYAGKPYQYGATGPNAYDCSGYTRQVFRHFGIELPRTSGEQRNAVSPVAAGGRKPGDLIFFLSSGGHVYHTGIYAGGNKIWVAPTTGKSVMLENIWSSQVSYGRAHS